MIVNILLPSYTHSDHNAFFSILKNVVFRVGRVKLTEHFLDNAFREGMLAREYEFDFNAAATWNSHSPRRDKISLWTLLGCWASRNCPTIGNILFGDCWQSTDSLIDTADDIDNFVFTKMKCILVELNVSQSTLLLLKQFVKVPAHELDVENMVQISPKMKLFDVKINCWQRCWTSLRRGEWLGVPQNQIDTSISFEARNEPKRTLVDSKCVTNSLDNRTPVNLGRKRPYENDMSKVPELAGSSKSLMDAKRTNATPLDLTSKSHENANDIRSIEQPQLQSARPDDTSVDCQCNKDTPLNLTSNQSCTIEVNTNETTMRMPMTNEKLHEQINLLQGQLLFALQRELSQKDSLLDERNESLAEAQKSIVELQVQLIEKNLLNQYLERQVDEKNKSLEEIEVNTRIVSALRAELASKNESLAEIQGSNENLEQQLKTLKSEITNLKSDKELHAEIESALRLELAATNESHTEAQESSHCLQLQLTAKNESFAELRESVDVLENEKESITGIVSALRSELKTKDESLTSVQQSSRNLQMRLATLIESTSGLQGLVADLKNDKKSFVSIESALHAELTSKNELLTELQLSNQNLQLLLNTLKGEIAELKSDKESQTEIESALRLQLEAIKESFTEVKGSIHNLQLQLTAKNDSVAELCESINVLKNEKESIVSALHSELTTKNESYNNLQMQMATQIESLGGLQDVIVDLKNEKESLTENESILRVELTAKIAMLTEIQGSNHNMQLQLNAKNDLIIELRESANVLQTQLDAKNKSLADLNTLKGVIQETIQSLESEISEKKKLLTESEISNRSLRLELSRKDTSLTDQQSLVASLKSELSRKHSTSEIVAEVSIEMVNQARQAEPQNSPEALPTASDEGMEMAVEIERKSETTIPVEMIEQTLQPVQVFESDDRIVKSSREELLRLQFGWVKFKRGEKFRPGFLHPPDADGIERAQQVTSDGYPSAEKFEFSVFEKDLRSAKKKTQLENLNLLNKKFNFDFK